MSCSEYRKKPPEIAAIAPASRATASKGRRSRSVPRRSRARNRNRARSKRSALMWTGPWGAVPGDAAMEDPRSGLPPGRRLDQLRQGGGGPADGLQAIPVMEHRRGRVIEVCQGPDAQGPGTGGSEDAGGTGDESGAQEASLGGAPAHVLEEAGHRAETTREQGRLIRIHLDLEEAGDLLRQGLQDPALGRLEVGEGAVRWGGSVLVVFRCEGLQDPEPAGLDLHRLHESAPQGLKVLLHAPVHSTFRFP